MDNQILPRDSFDERGCASVDQCPERPVSGIWCNLPLGKQIACGDPRRRMELAPDREVVSGSAPNSDLWLIRTGILRLQRFALDGRRQILSLLLPGEIVGYHEQFREDVNVETVTQSGLCRIDRRRFESILARNSRLRADLFRQKQDQLDRLQWLTWALGAMGPEERLCAFLALSSKFLPYEPLPDGSGVLSMVLPRKDVADLLATTVETICRALHKLSEKGMIEIRDPAHFRLLDLNGLIRIGQVDGLYDKIACGTARQSRCRQSGVAPGSDCATFSCGR